MKMLQNYRCLFFLQNIARNRNLPEFDDNIPDNDQPINENQKSKQAKSHLSVMRELC